MPRRRLPSTTARSGARYWLALALPLLAALASLSLSACNTTAGAGRDLSSAGHAISNSAEEHKP